MPKPKLDERHKLFLKFLTCCGQAWDTNELIAELAFSRHQINHLGKDLAEHKKIQLICTETRGTLLMRAERNV